MIILDFKESKCHKITWYKSLSIAASMPQSVDRCNKWSQMNNFSSQWTNSQCNFGQWTKKSKKNCKKGYKHWNQSIEKFKTWSINRITWPTKYKTSNK